MNDSLNNDEINSIMELIITILFMGFGFVATAFMCYYMSYRVEATAPHNKINYTKEDYLNANTYTFTGYQAYMFSWCMDELSYVPLYWIGDSRNIVQTYGHPVDVNTDDTNNNKWVKLSTYDDNGQLRPMFIPYRNRIIVGTGVGTERNIKTIINMPSGSDAVKHFQGTDGLKYKLTLTDKYKSANDLGNNPVKGGKTFQWILLPTAAP